MAVQSVAHLVLLGMVAKGALLHAQTRERRVSDRRTRVESRDDNDLGIATEELDSDAGSTQALAVAERVDSATLLHSAVNFPEICTGKTQCADWFSAKDHSSERVSHQPEPIANENKPGDDSKGPSAVSRDCGRGDLTKNIYYRNKLEFSLDGGWLPVNIPFVFDVFLGDGYVKTPLNYTLVPVIASLRWQMDDIGGPWIFRGNWDLTASAAVTAIPRGPETRYIAWIMGIRRNFVPRHGRIAPYFDGRLGLGNIDAKEPLGVIWAQGQNFTFTMNMGSGVRYNFNPRYSISAGLNWMHISNLYLSEPKFANYGINVYGPMFGFNVRIGKARHHASE